MLILSKEKEQMENKPETPFSKYAATCLPDLPQASTFATLWCGGAVCRSNLLWDFQLIIGCCGNSMKSRSNGCQDQTGFSKNSTYVNNWWWPNSERLSTQIFHFSWLDGASSRGLDLVSGPQRFSWISSPGVSSEALGLPAKEMVDD